MCVGFVIVSILGILWLFSKFFICVWIELSVVCAGGRVFMWCSW